MRSRPIQSGPCATRMARCNSAAKNRVSSRPACSPRTWTSTFPQSCARSTRSTMSTASIPTGGRPSAACPSATAPSAASCLPPERRPTGAPSMIESSSSGEVRRHCQGEESRQLFLRQPRRQRPRGPNLDRLGKIAAWFQADNQGRTYDDSAVWGCSLQGRVCNAVLDGKFAANVTAAYSTGAVAGATHRRIPMRPGCG